MRAATIIGALLIVIGGFLLVQGGSFTTRKDVVKLGDLKISADEQHPVSPWIAGAAVLAGVALIATGVRSKA
jgi:divalent metal cation (Fe/Co/Zn/Cd) transporter